jgi:antirestriction protein
MAYEYDHDCPFEAFITNLGKYNEGELVGEWVKFPTTSEELQKVFERIGIGSKDDFGNPYEEWFISDYDCYVDGLYEKLGEYENLDELNYLASKLDELDDHDYNHFQAAMQISDYTGSIKDVINLIDNLDKYEIYPGVESNADLGHYYIEELGMMEVPDYLADYIDYEAYGRDVAINEMGQFTDYGYVRDTQESFTEYYDGDRENIPDEYRVMDFMVSGEKERKTMNYETFKQEFAEDIKEKLYERGYDDVRISFNNVEKTNQNYEAMSVVPEGSNVGVNFNIENAFANYEHTDDYAGVLASATMVIADGLDRAPAIDVSALMDYENMKEKLSVEVISAEANADLLANVPHDRMEDLAVVYRFVMESSEDGRASILVTNNLMDRMGVSHEQLRSDALENSPEIRPVVIMGMNEVMKEMMGPEVYEMFGIPDDAEETMYVATVPDKNSGAGVIAYQDFMDQAAERVGGDFFVLPSSINEILLVPDNGDMTADALRDMVKDVNAKEVSPEERLSDNVYHYDSKDHVFELAEKFEARLAPFDIKELRDLTAYDELELDTLGDEKTALFLIMSDTDGTFNFLISMIYTQMFNLLCVRPFLSDKYDLTQHPNYKLTADYDKRNYFDVVKFLSHNLILKADDEYQVIDVTE